jgi:hypothetical protein
MLRAFVCSARSNNEESGAQGRVVIAALFLFVLIAGGLHLYLAPLSLLKILPQSPLSIAAAVSRKSQLLALPEEVAAGILPGTAPSLQYVAESSRESRADSTGIGALFKAAAAALLQSPLVETTGPSDAAPQPCLSVVGPEPRRVDQLLPNKTTTRLILLAPDSEVLPTLAEVEHWLRPGYYTLLVENPGHLWPATFSDAISRLTTPEGVANAVENRAGHAREPAVFAALRAPAQACLATRGVAGILFAQVQCDKF